MMKKNDIVEQRIIRGRNSEKILTLGYALGKNSSLGGYQFKWWQLRPVLRIRSNSFGSGSFLDILNLSKKIVMLYSTWFKHLVTLKINDNKII